MVLTMHLGRFLSSLRSTGRVTVTRDREVSCGDTASQLIAMDAAMRLDGPSGLPHLDREAAMWATERLHAACTLFVFRDLGADEVERRLAVPCPSDPSSPATHLSVDLVLHHLPDLMRMVRGMAPGDPLLLRLHDLCREWPLSSVGVPGVTGHDIAPVWGNDGLRLLYVDRVLSTVDSSRVSDPRVRSAIEAAVGEHRALAHPLLLARAPDLMVAAP
jgi:hypothetical protein